MLEGEPVVNLEKKRYSIGDVIRGNCTSPPSNPPANLTWFINGNKVTLPLLFNYLIYIRTFCRI
ncbi:hypothetical protein O3M35_008945 [Rhynocoris fuscipes]|uniref:CD80-like immunoglobulin C2-set domain-containing protein n=1 Tax=Rhynocoris fuscipes TaxID=488301 RepID=A0AAW1D6J9_9HEMI